MPAGNTRTTEGRARRVSFSELFAGTVCLDWRIGPPRWEHWAQEGQYVRDGSPCLGPEQSWTQVSLPILRTCHAWDSDANNGSQIE